MKKYYYLILSFLVITSIHAQEKPTYYDSPVSLEESLILAVKYKDPGAKHNLMFYYYQQNQVEKVIPLAKELLKENDGTAYMLLGFYYAQGIGVKRDTIQGFNYLKKAATLGEIRSYVFLGTYYTYGEPPVKKDLKQAQKYFRKGCDLGDKAACQYLSIN